MCHQRCQHDRFRQSYNPESSILLIFLTLCIKYMYKVVITKKRHVENNYINEEQH